MGGRNNDRYVTYRCGNRDRTKNCDNKEIREEYIEAFVLAELERKLLNDEAVPYLIQMLNEHLSAANKGQAAQSKNKLPKFEYIVAMEPQFRGAWHCHLILVFFSKAPFIANDKLAKIWGHGFVSIRSLKNVDNIGAYLSAYLCDMELSEAINLGIIKNPSIKEVSDLEGKNKKYYVKEARLKMYPPGFRISRKSKGIENPVIKECLESQAMEEIDAAKLVWEKTVKISSEENEVVNVIN